MNSVNRMMFPGLATGLDTDQIVRDLMRVERLPLDRLNQKRQILEWQREDYREMNRLLTSFRTKVDGLRLQSGFSMRTVASSNEAILASKIVGNPSETMYTVEVHELAQAGEYASLTFDFTADHPGQKLSEAEGWAGEFAFTVNGKEFTVKEDDSVESLVVRMNQSFAEAEDDTGVRAEIVGKQLILRTLEMGQGTDEDPMLTIEVTKGDASVLGIGGEGVVEKANGKDPQPAEITINGVRLKSDTNRFIYDGIQIDVKRLTEGEKVHLSLSRDVDAIFDKVTGFVEAYNELIAEIHEKLGERRYRDYPPLTDEQREQLSESEIEKWEERARSGLIKNDPLLTRALGELRLDFYTAVEGVGHLSEIGITVGEPIEGYARYREGGKLYVDEDKLREAISTNFDAVMNLFTQSSQVADETKNYKETGIGKRLYASVNKVISQLNEKAGYPVSLSETDNSTISDQLRYIDERIGDMERRLLQIEERYWREFTALEKAMERLNQQNAWLLGQLESM